MKPTTEVEGIVLSVQDYRESDGIIRLLTQDKILSILARGIQKQTSKNRMITQVFSHVAIRSSKKRMGYHCCIMAMSLTVITRSWKI